MPIALTCSCGKRLQVADEFAGKRGQCPVCGGTLQIPERHASATRPSHESAQAVVADAGLDALFGPGRLERAVTPPAESAANLLAFDPAARPSGAGVAGGVRRALARPRRPWRRGVAAAAVLLAVATASACGLARREPATVQALAQAVQAYRGGQYEQAVGHFTRVMEAEGRSAPLL